jgi:hypothetical protein
MLMNFRTIATWSAHITFSRSTQRHAVGSSERKTELVPWQPSNVTRNAKINRCSTCHIKVPTDSPASGERA